MKNIFWMFLLLIVATRVLSQSNSDSEYSLINASDKAGFTLISLTDPYLSPLDYSGFGLRYEHSSAQFLSIQNHRLSKEGRLSGWGGLLLNPQNTAAMLYAGANYSWGMFYHLSILPQFNIRVGGNTDIDFGFKNLTRNINNPVNVDVALNVNVAAKASYAILLRRRTIMLNYELESPIVGVMFVPMGGASYFEMFELGALSNSIHFSSLHNKLGVTNQLSVSYPFKRSTWQIGIKSYNLQYQANNMLFKRYIYSVNLGVRYDLNIFSGRLNAAPRNFVGPEK